MRDHQSRRLSPARQAQGLDTSTHLLVASPGLFAEPNAGNGLIIFIYCNWVVTRWQWLFYMYTKLEVGY